MERIEFFSIIESNHTIQNPTSQAKLDRLLDYCDIADGQRILDLGCGKGWLAQQIAERWDVEIDGLELIPAFIEAGESRLAKANLKGRMHYVPGPALDFVGEPGRYDLALCLGASFAIGTFEEALAWLTPLVRPGGRLAIGDIYAHAPDIPEEAAAHFSGGARRSIEETAEMMDAAPLTLVGLLDSTLDEWDHYESQHWAAAEAWLRAHPTHPDRAQFEAESAEFKRNHLRYDRAALGWAIWVSRKS